MYNSFNNQSRVFLGYAYLGLGGEVALGMDSHCVSTLLLRRLFTSYTPEN